LLPLDYATGRQEENRQQLRAIWEGGYLPKTIYPADKWKTVACWAVDQKRGAHSFKCKTLQAALFKWAQQDIAYSSELLDIELFTGERDALIDYIAAKLFIQLERI
jgi:hypothetical protein